MGADAAVGAEGDLAWRSVVVQQALDKARELAAAEDRHLGWLMKRLTELGFEPSDRGVSDQLWHSLTRCATAEEFSLFMATAEDRGRRAGERFYEQLRERDPVSAEIFRKIAEEEIEHIRLAQTFFGFRPGQVEDRANSRPEGRTR